MFGSNRTLPKHRLVNEADAMNNPLPTRVLGETPKALLDEGIGYDLRIGLFERET